MLSRTANSLFWVGRYVERVEHLSRYINAQYLSSSDAPRTFDKKLVLESMLHMAQSTDTFQQQGWPTANERVISYLTVDLQNPYCIANYVSLIRENARGVRDNISVELWEVINRFYHAVQPFNAQEIGKKGPYDFCKCILNNVNMVKGAMDNTLLRNPVWSMLYTGIHLERALQIVQMILTKLTDIKKSESSEIQAAIVSYHLATLLRGVGGLDMSRHHYGTPPNRWMATDFLVLNVAFPKSVRYNLERLDNNLKTISNHQPVTSDSVEFTVGKLAAHLKFMTADEIVDHGEAFFQEFQVALLDIGAQLEKQYFIF